MKKLFALLTVIVFALNTHAQSIDASQIPNAVKKDLATRFPDANATWTQETPGFVDANFYKDKHRVVVMYTMSGGWIGTDTYVKEADFPQESNNWLKTNFPSGKVTSMNKSENDKGVTYQCDVKAKEGIYHIFFDKDGKFLRKDLEKN